MRKIYTPLQGVMLTLSLIFLVSEFTFAHSNLSKNAASVATSADIILVASGTTTLCQGNSVDLSVSGTYASYQWSTGESTASITVNSAGSYFLSATDSSSNVLFSDTVIVSVGSPATVNAGMDGIVCANNEWSMGGMAPGASIGGSASSAMWLGGTTSSFLDGRSDLDGGYMADTSEYGTTITFVLMTNDPGNGCPAASDTALVEFQNFPDLLPIPDQFNTCPFSVFNLASIPVVDANNAIGVYAYQDASNQPLASSVVTTSGTYYIVKATMTTPSCFDFEPVNVTIGNCTCALVLSKTQVNATCPGASDGSIDFSVSGGTAPYSYIWTTGDTTQDLNNIPAGLYSVVVTDAFFCMDTINVTITEQSALSATCSELTQASCPGVSDGTALILATGGSGSSSFQWYDSNANNLSVNSAVLSSVSPGIYQAIVTDGLNCMDTCSIEITSTGTTDTTLLSATTCDTALVGATQQTLQNQAGCDSVVITNTTLLPGDTVNLTATTCDTALVGITQQTFQNQVGCDSVVIINTALDSNCTIILNCNISSTNATCFGGSDGTATANILNGTAPFFYSWSNGGTTATINNLTTGSYSLIITDAVGSTGSCTVTISEPGELSISCSVLQNVTCAGGSDGALDFIISGGTQPYGVSVVGSGGIPVNINGIVSGGLLANTYTVTVTDSSGCTDTCMVTISEPDSLIATCVIDQEILCNGQHATASASAVGGTGSYSYLWSNGSTTATNDSLLGGTYTITITDSLGCTSECMVVIVEPAPLTVACSIDQEISCAGANDGAASVIATGGTTPYTYSWSNGMTTASISSLSPNTYTVIVLDSNGCVNTCSVIINDAAPLAPIVAGSNSPLCDNNLLMLSASGTYSSYAWVGPNTFSSAMQNPSFVGGVAASGMYTVTATDTNGCSTSDSILVTINACFNLGDQTWVDINQDGLFNGSDTALAGVLVTLHDSAGAVIGTATTDSTGNYLFTDLLPGDYYVTFGAVPNLAFTSFNPSGSQVNGANGPGTSPTVTITNADVLTVDAGYITGFSIGDFVWLDVNGNGLPDDGATGIPGVTVTLHDSTGAVIGTMTTDSTGNYLFTNLFPGDYYVTFGTMPNLAFTSFNASGSQVNDANGPGTSPTVTITNADILTIDAGYVVGLSVGELVWLDVNGNGLPDDGATGIPGVSVTLHDSTGAVIDSTVTDANGNYLFTGVMPGDYYVTFGLPSGYMYTGYNPAGSQITFANGPGTTSNFTVTTTSVLTVDAGFVGMGSIGDLVWEDINNNGLDDDGGTGLDSVVVQLTYLGPDGILGTADDVVYTDTTDSTGNYIFTNLPPGDFVVEVLDGAGTVLALYSSTTGNTSAVTLAPGTMNNNLQDFGYLLNTNCVPPVLALIPTHIVCNGDAAGAIDLQVTSQFSPFTHIWSNNSTNEDQSNLVAGTYTVTVTDIGGCSTTASVLIIENPPFVIGKQVTNVSCYGSSDGVAVVSVSGGVGPYTYLWNTNPAQTDFIATGLSAGSATVTITDAVGCVTSTSITIIQPSLLDASASVTGVSCNGAGDGSVTVNPIGGTPYYNGTYDYLWNTIPAQTTQTATGLSGGFYTVIISDSIWCTKTLVVPVPEPDVLMVNVNPFHVTCNGGNNGKGTAIPSGGTQPYSYSWSDGQTTQVASNLTAGNYSVILTDANGCTAVSNLTIIEPAAITISSLVVDVSCGGANDGKILLSVSGGTAPYAYLWNTTPVLTASSISNLTAGAYSVVVTDANGCQHVETYTINDPNPIDPVIVATNVSCYNGSDGSAIITGFNGGVSPYNILWSNGNSTMNNSGLSAGTYYLTVTDSLGCAHFDSVIITEPMELLCNSIVNDATCNASSTGSIITSVSGGTAPYSYSWNDGSTSSSLSGLAAGTYTLMVTDSLGCTKTEVYTVGEPSKITLVNSVVNVLCAGGSNGSATANPGGGTPPYSYSWSDGQLTQTANGLSAGTYTLNVTDANGCVKVSNVIITEPDSLIVGCSVINTNCSGANDGSASAIPSGGAPGYTYAWNSVPVQTTQTATNLPPGTYTVVVTDQNNCTATAVCSVAPAGQLLCTTSSTNVTCHGGSNGTATVNGSGGTAPYSYTWLTSPVQNTQTILGLSAGSYQVVVTDAVGCSDTCVATISEPGTLLALYVPVNPTCPGGTDGSIDVTMVGGTAPYTFAWTNGAATEDLAGIGAGVYGLTVFDANNCQYQAFIIITEPPLLVCTISSMDESCGGAMNGSAVASVSGGTAPYMFLWSNGGTDNSINNISAGNYTLTVTDANGCTSTCIATVSSPPAISCSINTLSTIVCNGDATGSVEAVITGGTAPYSISWNTSPVQTTSIATGLTAGTYTATIYDANGCSTSCSVTLSEPPALTCSTTCTHITCNGGSDGTAFVSAAGGTAPYSYSWNTVPSQNSQVATGLSVGTYTATITDANGCTVTCSIDIIEPPALLVNVIVGDVSCNGASDGTATAQVVGGTAPYSFLWSTGDTTATVSGLSQGQYILTVTDDHNCSVSVLVMVTQPNPIGCNVLSTPVTCNGANDGTATVGAAGGLQPFTYQWSTSPVQNSITATGLSAGMYTVTVTDALGCTTTCSTTVVEPTAIVCSTAVLQNINCNSNTNGIAQAFASGGSGPYSFSWNTNPVQTTAIASGLSAGSYTVTITDALGCTSQCSVTITQPDELLCSINNLQLNCASDTGSLTVVVNGGTPNYSYVWNTTPAQTTATASGVGPGTYTVVVTDNSGCSTACTITVLGANPIAVTASSTPESCVGAANGTVSVISVQGGTAPYVYQWNTIPVQTTQTATGLAAGVYEVIVTDVNGCTATESVVVGAPIANGATIVNVMNASCNQAANGSATAAPIGGVAPFNYLWSDAQTNPTAILLTAGIYTVTITDFNGCTATASVQISEPAPITCNVNITDASCFSATDGSIALSNVSGGTPPYNYVWNSVPVQTTQVLSNVPHGTYTVTITDANGCTTQKTATIMEPSEIVCNVSSTSANCGVGNGTATVSVVGGSPGYTYSWSTTPIQTNATAVGLVPGSYSVIVTDSKGCTSVCSVIVQGTGAITCTSTTIHASCNGSSDGSITITNTSGGLPPYTYTWNTTPVQIGAIATGLSAGTYTVVVNSADGCSGVKSIVVLEPAPVPSPIVSSNSPVCDGDIVQLTSSAGYSSYSWAGPNNFSSSQQNPMFSSTLLLSGVYTLTVTDLDGCTATATVLVDITSCVNVGDMVWYDTNGNGMLDAGEPGIGGVTVTLYDANTNTPTTFTTTTDSLGNYLFTNVPSGNYYAVFSNVPGLTFTSNVPGGSQVSGNNGPGSTDDFTVGNTDVLTVDAGYIGTGMIGDYVWEDTNGNGLQDDGNTGIPGAVVQLTWYGPDSTLGTSDDVIFTDTTDSNGAYLFSNLPPGDFEVMIMDGTGTVLDGFTNTTGGNTTNTTLSPGNMVDLLQDFGYLQSVDVGDQVWVDSNQNGLFDPGEQVIPGVTVLLHDNNTGAVVDFTVTDSLGNYLFTNVSPGDYYVSFGTVPGYTYTTYNPSGSQVNGANGPGTTPTFNVSTTDVLTIDQGYVGTGTIGDYVWEDTNGNGLQDDGNTGIPGAVVQLTWYGPDGILGTTDDVVLIDTTDANGGYLFEDLEPGDYDILVFDGSGTVLDLLTNTTGGNMTSTTLSPGNMDDLDQDFGYQPGVNVGDFTWIDLNGNGLHDTGEPVVSGVGVTLYTSTGTPVATAVTDTNGNYLFTNVAPGNYFVVFDSVPGYDYTMYNPSGSQVNGAMGPGSTPIFNVSTTDVLTIDQGYLGSGTIGDYVWEDTNGNGLQDDGNTGIPGAIVQLTWYGPDGILGTADDVMYTDTTDANGGYLFDNLPPGMFDVLVMDGNGTVLDGLTNTTGGNMTSTTLSPGNMEDLDQDFGYQPGVNVGDFTWIDLNGNGIFDSVEPVLSGVGVTLYTSTGTPVSTAVTDTNGNYLFTNVAPGNYFVVFDSVPGYDYTMYNPSGSQVNGGMGPGSTPVFNVSATDVLTIDQGYLGSGTIGDYVWEDTNGNGLQDDGNTGIPGAVVQLTWYGPDGILGTADDVIYTDTTDANGGYLFDNLPPGMFDVLVMDGNGTVLDGLTNTTGGNMTTTTLSPGNMDDLDQDFGYQPGVNVGDLTWLDLNGNGIFDSGEPVLSGVGVTLYTSTGTPVATAVTDTNGNYLFTNVAPGDYYVVFDSVPGFDYTMYSPSGSQVNGANGPGSTPTFNVSTTDVLTIDQGYLGSGTIGDYIWEDTNGNGLQDDGNTGILGAVVQLTWYGPDGILGTADDVVYTDTTDANGGYFFDNLPPGLFDVLVMDGTGTVLDGLTSTTGGNMTSTTLSPGNMSDLEQDFGYQQGCTLSCAIVDSTCTIDFDYAQLQSGEFVAEQYANVGIHVSGTGNQGLPDAVIVYDSNDSTQTLDPDLQVGIGNLLILPSDVVDANNDSLVDNPDDSQYGGTMTFVFDNPVNVNSLVIVDQDHPSLPIINAYDAGNNLVATTTVPQMGDMSVQTVFLNATNVSILEIVSVKSFALGPIDLDCVGGSKVLTVNPSGGTGPYTYSWNTTPVQTTQSIDGTNPGTYVATVTDVNGCTTTCNIVTAARCPVISLNTLTYRGGNNVSCNQSSDGAIYALVNDGAAPYTYQWSSGQTTANVSSISAGTYMLTVTDNNGCSATSSVTLKEPALLACSTDYLTNVGCNGNSDGEISISINGGIGPYVSMWNTTPVTFGTTLSNVPAGSYTLSVTDTNGCVDVQTYQVNEPQELSAWSQKVNVLCHGDASGAIDLKVSKGTAPYTYMWNDGATTQDRTGLNSGNYTVTVTDANGCIKIHDKRISQPRKFRHSSVVTDVSCFNGADGTIDLTITGAKAPYTYLWKDGTTTEDRINMSKGWHRVTVTDTRGCSTTRHIRVNHPKFLGITATVQDVSIPGGNDGSVSSSVSGGVGPYTYNWSNGATTNSISNIVSGNYRLTVTDANGCVRIRNVVVSEPAATAPLSCSPIGSNIPCGTSTGSVSVTATGGYPPYDYFWNTSPYQTTQTATGLAQGTYLVQVTDSRGASSAIFCFATVSCTNARTTTIVSEDESLLSVYPNPFSSELKINVLSAFEDETFELQIVDILGKTHHYSVLNTTKGINTHSLILDSLPDGVYFIRLKSNLSSFTEKLIKR